MRKLTSLFAATILALHLTACTSSDSKDDGTEDGAVAESTEGTDADLQNLDAPPAENAVASNDGANEGFLDEQLPEDALGESTKTAAAEQPPADIVDNTTPPPAMEEPKSEPAITEAAPIETPADTSVAAVDTGTTSSTEPSSNLSDSSAGIAATTSSEPSMTESAPVAEAKPKVSLQKIEAAPIHREGVLLNAVYIARSGDNYKKISKLIYGSDDKVKELKKVNPSVKPRVGDKIYYNSPVRPADDTKMMTYYEDAGLVPDVYVTQEGDNMKKLGKTLLGHKDGWKEIWATNMNVDSKDALPAGTELRYWKSAPAPAPVIAANPEVAPPTEASPQGTVAMNAQPEMSAPPPMPENPPQAAMPEMPAPPPPAPPEMQAPPPPPPVAEMQPPPPPPAMEPPPEIPPPPPEMAPPPPPSPVVKKAPQNGETGGMDNDMIMSLAGAGIIAVGLAAMIIVRKRRQNRDMAQAFNDTQVGT